MQRTETARRHKHGRITKRTLNIAAIGMLVLGLAAVALTVELPARSDTESREIRAPQLTSDELYATEAAAAVAQVDGWQPTVGQLTSDEAWAIEASLVDAAEAHRRAEAMQLTSDEAWALEQAQLLSRDSEQRSDHDFNPETAR
ncbi:MAG TPA: hypothetical protein VFV93_17320 [Thermomicrobiales bacterium]|nr:hypothetical protein [Thermomicrobiales bacterium]